MEVLPLAADRPLDPDDADALAARSDLSAFTPIYERHRDAVYRYLRARSGSEDAALELTAITFERALLAVHRYRSQGGGMGAWLLRIARNAAIDADRRRRPLISFPRGFDTRPDPGPTPDEALLVSDEHRHLRALVADLPPDQRDALALRFGAELSVREIGLVLGKREAATQKIIGRGLARLKEAYRDHD
jgi:RNA polymerase sigma-70 factor (ECF subfamily)